jgi:hypothetical protein
MTARGILLAALGLFALSVEAGEQPDAKLRTLMKERLTTLREVETHLERAYREGQVPVDQFLHASAATLEAELELAESKDDRLSILQKGVELAKKSESFAAAAAKAGVAPPHELLKAKANRLAAEIAVEKEKRK